MQDFSNFTSFLKKRAQTLNLLKVLIRTPLKKTQPLLFWQMTYSKKKNLISIMWKI
jgi:hypothetical protein